jgi:hypothetical protein
VQQQGACSALLPSTCTQASAKAAALKGNKNCSKEQDYSKEGRQQSPHNAIILLQNIVEPVQRLQAQQPSFSTGTQTCTVCAAVGGKRTTTLSGPAVGATGGCSPRMP